MSQVSHSTLSLPSVATLSAGVPGPPRPRRSVMHRTTTRIAGFVSVGFSVVLTLLFLVLYTAVRAAGTALMFVLYLAVRGAVSAASHLLDWIPRVGSRLSRTN